MLTALFESVQRAGPVFTGRATQSPDGEGYRFTLQLLPNAFSDNEVGQRARKDLGRLIQSFVRESGWRCKAASFKKGYLELAIAASRASSRTSQKRSASL